MREGRLDRGWKRANLTILEKIHFVKAGNQKMNNSLDGVLANCSRMPLYLSSALRSDIFLIRFSLAGLMSWVGESQSPLRSF
jgi:hypothetical protein